MERAPTHEGQAGRRRYRRNRHRLSHRSPRWILVFLFTVASGLGVARLFSPDDGSVTLWVARETLVPGHVLTTSSLKRVEVGSADAEKVYLPAAEKVTASSVIQEVIPAGQFVPRAALGLASHVSLAPIVVEVGQGQELTTRSGSSVQVWVAHRKGNGWENPQMLAGRARVGRLVRDGGGPGSLSRRSVVELFIPQAKVGEALAAINAASKVSLVPLPGRAPR